MKLLVLAFFEQELTVSGLKVAIYLGKTKKYYIIRR